MECAKINNIKLYLDNETGIISITNEYVNEYNLLSSLITEVENYLTTCKEHEFNSDTLKLKFTIDKNRINIFNIFDKYKKLLNDKKILYIFLMYGYWFSKLAITYYETYFNIKKLTILMKDTLIIKIKCDTCSSYIEKEICVYSDFSQFNKYYKGNYTCEKCKEEIQNKREQEIKEKQAVEKYNQDAYLLKLKSMPYKDYLETDHWKQLRKRKLRLSGYKCQICGSKEDLNVHHNTYENRGCEKDEDLVVLCNECHKKHHGITDGVNNNVKSLLQNSENYKTKLFTINFLSQNTEIINEFILHNVNELKDIKTNLTDNIFAALIIYK
jgi:5-methylcytosine-specific restriction endonuclease McrA